jgi:hypothetical protein
MYFPDSPYFTMTATFFYQKFEKRIQLCMTTRFAIHEFQEMQIIYRMIGTKIV